MIFSCVIPVKDKNDPKLQDLITSIKAQDFPQDQIEIIVIDGEMCGDPEQAKAMGIRQAKGEICAMFCADNQLVRNDIFSLAYGMMTRYSNAVGCYSKHYAHNLLDNSLNRYFSLIGNNDPIAFYLEKTDRLPINGLYDAEFFSIMGFKFSIPSLGDNGFFFRRSILLESDVDNFYPMDVCEDLRKKGHDTYLRFGLSMTYLWHKTSDNLISFLIKRYKYARDLFSDRDDRRWKMVDTTRDKWMLAWFVVSVLFVVPCLLISFKGFLKIRDWAWFWHWPVCAGFLITYTILAIRNLFKHGRLFQCPQPA